MRVCSKSKPNIPMKEQSRNELLLSCLAGRSDEPMARELEQLSSSDWEVMVQQSIRHGVACLLYHRLSRMNLGVSLPSTALQSLREAYLHNAERNVGLYHELSSVLTALHNEGIPVIVLKGAYLAEGVYGDIALRPMVDVDLLVRREGLSRVKGIFIELGYGMPDNSNAESSSHVDLRPFTKPSPIPFEVHWSLPTPHPFRIDIDGLWERAHPATIAGVEVLGLSPEDLLLTLTLHACNHHKFGLGLISLCDISEVVRHYNGQIDYEQLHQRAREWGISNCLHLTLLLSKELLQSDVPDALLIDSGPREFDRRLVSWAKEQIFMDRKLASSRPSLSPPLHSCGGA